MVPDLKFPMFLRMTSVCVFFLNVAILLARAFVVLCDCACVCLSVSCILMVATFVFRLLIKVKLSTHSFFFLSQIPYINAKKLPNISLQFTDLDIFQIFASCSSLLQTMFRLHLIQIMSPSMLHLATECTQDYVAAEQENGEKKNIVTVMD